MLQTEFCNTLQHNILFFVDSSSKTSSAICGFRILNLRYLTFIAKRKYRYFELCVYLKIHVIQKKTEKQIKKPVHSLLLLTRFLRNDLLSTESDNIPSLQSLTSVLQRLTVFVKSSNDKYLFKVLDFRIIFCHTE